MRNIKGLKIENDFVALKELMPEKPLNGQKKKLPETSNKWQKLIIDILADGKPRHITNIFPKIRNKFPDITGDSIKNQLIILSGENKIISTTKDVWALNQK